MKNIIVPTDFSGIAENAFNYANALGQHWDSSIKVVNVVHPTVGSEDGILIPSMERFIDYAKEEMAEFVQGKYDSTKGTVAINPKVTEEITVGFAIDTLVELSGKPDVDLMLLGTTGEGVKPMGKIFGSVSSSVARKAKCPVLLVPPEVSYQPYKRIMYACNFEVADKSMLNQLLGFADGFNADIDLVHVDTNEKGGHFDVEKFLVEQSFQRVANKKNVRMNTVPGGNLVWKSLNDYAVKNEVDLIVLLTRHRGFWDKLFHKSTTKAMVNHAQIPLLIFHAA